MCHQIEHQLQNSCANIGYAMPDGIMRSQSFQKWSKCKKVKISANFLLFLLAIFFFIDFRLKYDKRKSKILTLKTNSAAEYFYCSFSGSNSKLVDNYQNQLLSPKKRLELPCSATPQSDNLEDLAFLTVFRVPWLDN
jgi:hypothetical protein